MKLSTLLLNELKQESKSTKSILAAIPWDKIEFKPHEKSMSLKRLAIHVAEINGWWKECLLQDELDFSKGDHKPVEINSTDELLEFHDKLIAQAEGILSEVAEDEFAKNWTMRNGDVIYFTQQKRDVVRTWCLNHLYHHRAQLTVYLRLLNVKVPGMYGPTADDQTM